MTEQQATPHRPAGDECHIIDTQSDRARIEAAAADHLWDATIEGAWLNEYRKGEDVLHIYWHPGRDSARQVSYFRGDIGRAYLAPTDGALAAAVDWLAGRH